MRPRAQSTVEQQREDELVLQEMRARARSYSPEHPLPGETALVRSQRVGHSSGRLRTRSECSWDRGFGIAI